MGGAELGTLAGLGLQSEGGEAAGGSGDGEVVVQQEWEKRLGRKPRAARWHRR